MGWDLRFGLGNKGLHLGNMGEIEGDGDLEERRTISDF
jgi:hypothetical protein